MIDLPSHQLCLAPMMDYTDRHFRYWMRLTSQKTWVYTEMLTTQTLLHGETARFLAYHPHEQPIALQVGGNEPSALARCAVLAENHGYQEINLNVGCPSDRVLQGQFGACLMKQPQLVADCVTAMCAKTSIPVTVKTRLGVDDLDHDDFLYRFIELVAAAGCRLFIIHARKAWLQGLSPKENREIPPLQYDRVYQLKRHFPALTIIINGGINQVQQIPQHLTQVDGVMVGRAPCQDALWLWRADQLLKNSPEQEPNIAVWLHEYVRYAAQQQLQGVPISILMRPLFGIFYQRHCARRWRRYLSENFRKNISWNELLHTAESFVSAQPSSTALT